MAHVTTIYNAKTGKAVSANIDQAKALLKGKNYIDNAEKAEELRTDAAEAKEVADAKAKAGKGKK